MTKLINLCPFCIDSPEYPFSETSRALHDSFGYHTLTESSITWRPEKGHVLYESHRKLLDLFNHTTLQEKELERTKKVIEEFNKLPWYLKAFKKLK